MTFQVSNQLLIRKFNLNLSISASNTMSTSHRNIIKFDSKFMIPKNQLIWIWSMLVTDVGKKCVDEKFEMFVFCSHLSHQLPMYDQHPLSDVTNFALVDETVLRLTLMQANSSIEFFINLQIMNCMIFEPIFESFNFEDELPKTNKISDSF